MKYTIEESTLTSIADAIRTQYDDDSPINPLDMAEAILGIEGGGSGGVELPFEIAFGEFEVTSDYACWTGVDGVEDNFFSIEHGMNSTPNFFYLYSDMSIFERYSGNTLCEALCTPINRLYSNSTYQYLTNQARRINGSSNTTLINTSSNGTQIPTYKYVTMDSEKIGIAGSTQMNIVVKAGVKYKWVAMRLESPTITN